MDNAVEHFPHESCTAKYIQYHAIGTRKGLRPTLVCVDGFSFSVQASKFHYCYPRTEDALHYETVEVGFPSEPCDELMPYAEDPELPCGIFGFVPVSVVEAVIRRHGGIDLSLTFSKAASIAA